MKNYLQWLVGIASIVLIAGGIKTLFPAVQLGGSQIDQFNSMTVTSLTIGTAKQSIVASNGARRYLRMENNSPTGKVFCNLDGDTVAASSNVATSTAGAGVQGSFFLAPTASTTEPHSFEIRGYTGNVNCAATAAATTTLTTSP